MPINKSNRKYWRNRPFTDSFEPGSTFKSFVIAYALDNQLITEDDQLYCKKGSFAIQRRIIRESGNKGAEWLLPDEILKYSSNIGAAKIGLLLGNDHMQNLLDRFAFGHKTAVGLPGESRGLLQPIENWNDYDLASAAFGQGIGVTTLQLARAFSSLVNGGFLLKPHIFLKTEQPGGNASLLSTRQVIRKTISQSRSDQIRDMLGNVVAPKGTGLQAALASYSVGGKTGTAQRFDTISQSYAEDDYVVSFIGFFPLKNPALVVYVIVDQPQIQDASGGKIAAPVFKTHCYPGGRLSQRHPQT